MRISCALIGLNSRLPCCCKPTHETWEYTIGSLHNCLLESLKEFKMMTLKFVESKEGRVNKASGGPDELSKASCVRGCWAPWSADWLPLFFFLLLLGWFLHCLTLFRLGSLRNSFRRTWLRPASTQEGEGGEGFISPKQAGALIYM